MLVSAVVHPDAFREENFDEAGQYRQNVLQFLRGVVTNGLILGDSQGKLRSTLIRDINSLPTSKVGSRISGLFTEIIKGHCGPKRLISCKDIPHLRGDLCLGELAKRVAEFCLVDGTLDASALSEYVEGDYEEKRIKYANFNRSLHQIPENEVADVIKRSVRFSKRLRFYESYLGQSDYYGRKRFQKGMEYIVNIWRKHGHFFSCDRGENRVEIITPVERGISPIEVDDVRRQIWTGVGKPLEDRCRVSVTLTLKRDDIDEKKKFRVFHYRLLETESVVLEFDKGFDLFAPVDPSDPEALVFVANNVSLGDPNRCSEYRQLPPA